MKTLIPQAFFFFVIEADVSKSLLFVRIQIKNKMFYLFSFNLVLCFYRFHFFIFDQVLEIAKKFLVFDGEENNMFVVPVLDDNGFDIDWKTMQMYKQVPPVEVPSYEVYNLKKSAYLASLTWHIIVVGDITNELYYIPYLLAI